jgi:hypothetical protein
MLKKFLHSLSFCALVTFIVLQPRFAEAWDWPGKKVSTNTTPSSNNKPTPQQEPVSVVSPTVNPITQAAVQQGVLACTSRINQITKFLTTDNQSGAVLSFSPNGPDQHIFSASLEVLPPNNPSLYASTSFTPTPSGGCDAVYDTVQFVPGTCLDIVHNRFKITGAPSVIKRDIIMLNAGSVRFFLMSADRGCVVIKKEVIQ